MIDRRVQWKPGWVSVRWPVRTSRAPCHSIGSYCPNMTGRARLAHIGSLIVMRPRIQSLEAFGVTIDSGGGFGRRRG